MEQTGYVTEVTQDKIRVSVRRESSCGGNCVSCKGCPAGTVVIECDKYDGARVGDAVRLTMENVHFYRNAALGYGLPAALTVVGAVMGYMMYKSDSDSVIGAVIGLLCGLVIARLAVRQRDVCTNAEPININTAQPRNTDE